MTGRGFGRDEHPEELLSASLSGDVSPAERAALDAHLAGCARCRATLEAFGEERHLIAGLREVPPPRDLGARVRAGIEGRAVPWWRRPSTLVAGFASLATVAAALLAVVVLSGIPRGEVGNATPSPSASAVETPTPEPTESNATAPSETPVPSSPPVAALQPGEVGYLSVDGEQAGELQQSFVNDESGEVVELGTVPGPPVAAAVSPTGEFVAYITEVGLAGVNQVAVARLSDGMVEVLGCTIPFQFTDRLAWSDDGRYLAYTLAAVELGGGVDCGGVTGDGSAIDAWVYDVGTGGDPFRVTQTGNAFAADFLSGVTADDEYRLLVSYAGVQPYTEPILMPSGQALEAERANAFLPVISPDGEHAVFWRGVMTPNEEGGWRFERGGLPYLSGEPVDGQPSWSGEETFFPDLQPVGGAAFESGQFGWSPDGMLVGFWLGEWTGPPQSDDGSYPSSKDVYVRHVLDGRADAVQRVQLDVEELQRIVAVALDGVRATVLVTVVQPAAGDLAVPSSTLYVVPLTGDEPRLPGIGASWTGPAVVGGEAAAP